MVILTALRRHKGWSFSILPSAYFFRFRFFPAWLPKSPHLYSSHLPRTPAWGQRTGRHYSGLPTLKMGWSSNPKYRWYHADKKLHDFNGLFFERYYQFMALWWYLVFWYDNLWHLRTDKITKEKKTWVIKGKKTKAKGNNRKRLSSVQRKNENWKKRRRAKMIWSKCSGWGASGLSIT